MFEGIPVEVGLVHEGERVRRKEMQVELGGPEIPKKFELVRVKPPGEVQDGRIEIVGPDLTEMEAGKSYPIGILVEIAGKSLGEDLEGVIERRIHEYSNYIQGLMHLNQRYDIWIRLSRRSFEKGFNTLRYLGQVLIELFKGELPIIERIQVTFFTDPKKIEELYTEVMKIYETRDAKARGLRDEDVDTFYGCILCQSFAPTHVCVITPERYANCGAISWFDGRAASSIDPKGPIFRIEKGKCLDPVKGEYEGVNEAARQRSLGEISRICLYTGFGYPHTSCGCFEGIAFFMPDVEGYGIVHRGFRGPTVNGLPFSSMADSTAGGRQIDGFHGISLEYLRSRKFLKADGGWNAVVWMPLEIKERMREFIPAEMYEKIATEKDASNIGELRAFLVRAGHPVIERWKKGEALPEGRERPVIIGKEIPLQAGGVRILLKNARIYAERVIIQPTGGEEHERKG